MNLTGETRCGCGAARPVPSGAITLGIYEKAMRDVTDWDSFFASVAAAGFSFVDLSIDESEERRARLHWPVPERRMVRDAASRAGVAIGGLCLSVHRAVGPGSADPKVREEARHIYTDAITLARDLGAPIVQVAGYYAYYEEPHADQRRYYVEALAEAAQTASLAGVLLGIENVDGNDVTSISRGMEIVREINSPWLHMYPDIGNIAEQELDTTSELAAGKGHMLAIHIKDVRPGEPRRVPLGEGTADFPAAFAELRRQGWSGRMMIEMWNDNAPDSDVVSARARAQVASWLTEAGLTVA